MIKFKGHYRGRYYTFTLEQIHGSKIGIPSIDISGQLVSIWLIDELSRYSEMSDDSGKEIYENDYLIATDISSSGK